MSEKEREENPVAPEDALQEKRERAIGRRRFMGLTFKAVVGGVGLTLFAQTRPAHAVTCDGVPNECGSGENVCYGYNNACIEVGGSNECTGDYSNVCEDGQEQQNICADTAPNVCIEAGANKCSGEVYNMCVVQTGSTNTCTPDSANVCYGWATN